MYAKLKEGVLSYAPTNYELEDGSIIVNFNRSDELMNEYGFKNVIDIQPLYDKETQYLSIEDYVENNTSITINYIINDILITPTFEERLASVEEVILNLL